MKCPACGVWMGRIALCRDCKLKTPEVAAQLQQLSQEFGEPVLPLSKVCDALTAWAQAIEQNQRRVQPQKSSLNTHGLEYAAQLNKIMCDIRKSGLLWRLLYLGQAIRTEECPVHKGHMHTWLWVLGGDECCDGSGWLEADLEQRERRRVGVRKAKQEHGHLWPK